jgi:hypothetical protein
LKIEFATVQLGYSDFVLRCAAALRGCKMGSWLQLDGIGWIGGFPGVVRAWGASAITWGALAVAGILHQADR